MPHNTGSSTGPEIQHGRTAAEAGVKVHPSATRAPAREAGKGGTRAQPTAIAQARARAREAAGRWPVEPGPFDVPQPACIARTLVWLLRDRGIKSPLELQGATRRELEMHSRARANRTRSRFERFEEALEAAIDSGWIVAYESTTGTRFLPNYTMDMVGSSSPGCTPADTAPCAAGAPNARQEADPQ